MTLYVATKMCRQYWREAKYEYKTSESTTHETKSDAAARRSHERIGARKEPHNP